jgi:hypothetical protein
MTTYLVRLRASSPVDVAPSATASVDKK